jgi:NADH:ubiquinone oxidoreductase subunit 3 (subunit A)
MRMHALITYITTFTLQTWALGIYIVALFTIVSLMLGLSWVLGGRDHGRAKTVPFESGVVPVGSAQLRLSAKFYLVAMFFVIFDLEAVFLYAWDVPIRLPLRPPPSVRQRTDGAAVKRLKISLGGDGPSPREIFWSLMTER